MIRLLAPEDVALWKAVRLEAVACDPVATTSTMEETLAQSEQEWLNLIIAGYIFVYMDGEQSIGSACYRFVKSSKIRHRATVMATYVNPGYRGKGVMDWLLGALCYHAKDNAVELLHLTVATENIPAIRCYERNGFTVYGTQIRSLKIGGTYIDEHMMVKYL